MRHLPIALAGLLLSSAARAQCRPPASSNEAKLLAFFAGPLTFSEQARIVRLGAGHVIIAGDLTYVPQPSRSLATSTGVCGYQKSENTGLASLFPRPRVIVGLGAGLSAEVSYLPPVTVGDATPNLASIAVAWASRGPWVAGVLDLSLRVHATLGKVEGPITCPARGLQQTNPSPSPCYGTTPSKDTYEPRLWGLEAAVAQTRARLSWYAGAGLNVLSPHFQVGFTPSQGAVDRTTIDVSLTRLALFAGGGWALEHGVTLSAQLYSMKSDLRNLAVPEDATTARAGIAWRVR